MWTPDLDLAKTRYRDLAKGYDFYTRRMEPVRDRAIQALELRPGDHVLDMASGTGKSFAKLLERIGPSGHLVAVEPCAEMMSQARERAPQDNVTLVESSAEKASLKPASFDAVLFMYAQDVLQSDKALAEIFASLKPGARVVSAGFKLLPWWFGALPNAYLLAVSHNYFTTFKGLRRPWRRLQKRVPNLQVKSTFFGSGYLAQGHYDP